jgi:hypothetical protein
VIRHEDLEFPPLNCALDSELGDYYQDFSAAITILEDGQHAAFDERGIPAFVTPGHPGVPDATTAAQYALANITAVRRGEASRERLVRRQLDWLVETQERTGEWAGCWLMRYDNRKYGWLRAPWTGSLASGNAISALLRGWALLGEDRYRESARLAYEGLHTARPGAALCAESDDALWYEEYPAEPPIHVLNGHVYTLFAVLDCARAFGDGTADERWRKAAATVLVHLNDFDLGYWSLYDLGNREPTSLHYHKNIHIPQLRILAALTGESRFDEVGDRWERYLHSFACRARWWFELRARRWRRW